MLPIGIKSPLGAFLYTMSKFFFIILHIIKNFSIPLFQIITSPAEVIQPKLKTRTKGIEL